MQKKKNWFHNQHTSCGAHVYFDVKISNFGNDPLNMVMKKHVSNDPTRKNLLYED